MDPLVQLARVPRRPPRSDLVLAGVLAVWAVLEALLAGGPGSALIRVLTGIGFAAPLVLRRRAPLQVLLAISAVFAVRLISGDVPEEGSMPFPAVLVAVFSTALYGRPQALAIAAAPAGIAFFVVAEASGHYSGPDPGLVDYAILSFFSLGSWAVGWLVRRRAAQLEQARAAAPELAREAVAVERARMARELHDVVSHSVSIVAVQAGAAEALLDEASPARPHVEAIRRTAHEALVELRRLVGVLREEDAAYAPQPGLERLSELLDEVRSAGLPVELVEEGARRGVPPGLDVAAYRILQESLTNVRRHAGHVATRVILRYGERELALEVMNAPGRGNGRIGAGSGHGLIGMRERVRLFGGTIETSPLPGGGFRVEARLPLEDGPA